jgi:hypothetical protein
VKQCIDIALLNTILLSAMRKVARLGKRGLPALRWPRLFASNSSPSRDRAARAKLLSVPNFVPEVLRPLMGGVVATPKGHSAGSMRGITAEFSERTWFEILPRSFG